MPQCQFPVFCWFCVLGKLHRKYSRDWTKQKPNLLFLPKLCEDRRWDGGGPGASLTTRGAAQPLAVPACRETIWSTSWRCPFAYKFPRREKPKGQISFSRNILQVIVRLGGSRSSSRHPTGEGNPCRRPSTPPWSPPVWCVSSLPWTMGP
jgi:hypothetical protein